MPRKGLFRGFAGLFPWAMPTHTDPQENASYKYLDAYQGRGLMQITLAKGLY
jgi:hypothetical protein